ncbi:MAG: hypothetical protein ACOYN0_13760 [Phycisphaerales bacterium]
MRFNTAAGAIIGGTGHTGDMGIKVPQAAGVTMAMSPAVMGDETMRAMKPVWARSARSRVGGADCERSAGQARPGCRPRAGWAVPADVVG